LNRNKYFWRDVKGTPPASTPPPETPPPSTPPPETPPPSTPPPEESKPPVDEIKQTRKKPPVDEIEQTRKKLLIEINRIDLWANTLVDNGLFDKQKKAFEKNGNGAPVDLFDDIQKHLKEARTTLYDGDLSQSDYHASKALRCYDKALYSSSRLWRFSNVYAGPIWIYLIGFLIAVLVFYWVQLDVNFFRLNPPGVRIQEAALHATTWGTVGAILRGLWFLKDKVSDRKYRNSQRIYFLSVPFLGGLFGAILYFMLVSGLFIVAPAQAPGILEQTGASTVAIIPLAALAGFNWEWAIMIFKRIGDSFKGEAEPEDKIEK
jgi:hypothetical protein